MSYEEEDTHIRPTYLRTRTHTDKHSHTHMQSTFNTNIHIQTNIHMHVGSGHSTPDDCRTHASFEREHVSVSRIRAVIPGGSGHIALVVVGPAVAVAFVEDEGEEVCAWSPGWRAYPRGEFVSGEEGRRGGWEGGRGERGGRGEKREGESVCATGARETVRAREGVSEGGGWGRGDQGLGFRPEGSGV